MKIKLLLLSAILLLAVSAVQAQGGFGILGGVNFQNLNGKDSNGDKLTNEIKPGIHAGFNYQMPIAPEFYFQPGLLFSTKGAKTTAGTIKLSYIELPLNLVYKGLLGRGYVMVGFGPYLGYKIGSKEVTQYGELKSFDAGGNIFAGYEMAGGLFFQLNTEFGMININPEAVIGDKTAVKNTGFGLSLGYRF
jgi:hypothetical protein